MTTHLRRLPRPANAALALFVALLFLYNHSAVCCGQFSGADEAEQLWFVERLLRALSHGDWVDLAKAVGALAHPPLRFVLSAPGLLLVPHSELGLRFGAILGSALMLWQTWQLGNEVGGARVAWASITLLAASALANWTSMAFGWSVAIAALLFAVRRLRRSGLALDAATGRADIRDVQAAVFVAFLINTGSVLFAAATFVLVAVRNRRNPGPAVRALLPWALLYALYYAVTFALIPLAARRFLGLDAPFGQLAQNLGRAAASGWNTASLRENLMGLNAYVLPMLGWVIFAVGVVYVVRHERLVALWLAPFALAWSFWFQGGSQQYFLWVFVCLLPFGVAFLHEFVPTRVLWPVGAVLIGAMLAWNFVVFLQPYGSAERQSLDRLLQRTWSRADRQHNIVEPFAAMGAQLDAVLGAEGRFLFDGSTAFVSFYYKDDPVALYHSRYAGSLRNGEVLAQADAARLCVRAPAARATIVAVLTADEVCPEDVETTVTWPGSVLRLNTLEAAPAP